MPDVVAKAMAVITGILLVGTLALLYITSRPPANTREVVAEFRDAFPVLEGMQLRTDGAISGSVGKIEVNKKGLAVVTLLVNKTVPAPHSDATATIRQADTTGDSYISYEPGDRGPALHDVNGKPTISCDAQSPTGPCTNTLAAPRFDDLINAFGPPEQAGVKLILQNLSMAVDQRGGDLNRSALKLVPALDAANQALGEVNSQNAALKRYITDMENVSGQAAARREQLGQLIGALDQTLQTTAANTAPLGAGIQALPATEKQLQKTLGGLTRAANSAGPLASQIAAGAPGLSSLLDKSPAFIDDLRYALRVGSPTLELTRQLLQAGAPTIEADPKRVVTGAFDLAPALSNLLKGILGGDETIKAFFGDEKDGKPDDRPGFGFGLGAIASEPGNQPGYPADWEDRRFLRLGATISCESFGGAIGQGCLSSILTRRAAQDRSASAKARRGHSAPAADRQNTPAAPVATPAPGTPPQTVLGQTLDALKVHNATDNVLDTVQKTTGKTPVTDLLDYLLRP